MKRKMLIFSAVFAGAATVKDTLAVLPFTGGSTRDEGETIAELFSFSKELNDVFAPIPRTSITRAISSEQQFQTGAGMTDPDAIAALGKQLGAKYVVTGKIAKLGNHNLLIISILKIDDLRQIAGDIETYTQIEDIQDKLPGMVRNIIRATQSDSSKLEKLAVVPVELGGNIDADAADTLAQILSINIIRSGSYAVYPRTAMLEQVQEEYKTRLSGSTADESIVDIGKGDNPTLVLSAAARRLGARNMFNASIINLEPGVQLIGRSVNYNTLDDGIMAMENLTRELTGVSGVPGDDLEAVRNRAAAGNRTGQSAAEQPAGGEKMVKKSGGNAFGYGMLNLAAGLGSFVQGDWGGGLTCVLGYSEAAGLILWDVSALSCEDDLAGIPGAVGFGTAGVTALIGFIRPAVYKKSHILAGIMDRINVAVVPGNKGGETVRLSYPLNFERGGKNE
jgi:TolB-like protein